MGVLDVIAEPSASSNSAIPFCMDGHQGCFPGK